MPEGCAAEPKESCSAWQVTLGDVWASKNEMLKCVLFRSGQDPIIVNLDIPEAEEHNNKIWIDDIHSKN